MSAADRLEERAARALTGTSPAGQGRRELLAVARRLAGAPEGATWWRGRDLVAVVRAADLGAGMPELDEERDEPRLAALVMAAAGIGIIPTAARLGYDERTVTRWREEAQVDRA